MGTHGSSLRQSHDEHPGIQNYDDSNGYDEGENKVDNSCNVVNDNDALSQTRVRPARLLQVIVQKQRSVENRDNPTQTHQDLCSPLGDFGAVMHRVTNGYIAVNRYEHHVCYRSRCDDVVDNVIQSAHDVTEKPAGLDVDYFNGHQQEAHKQVGDSQGEEEEVGGGVELPGEEG